MRELDAPDKVSIEITNRNGRVSVQTVPIPKKVLINASSRGLPVDLSDVEATTKGSVITIAVRPRSEQNRIDLTIQVPVRSRVRVTSDSGAVDVVGNLESAEVQTNTGTIHADVPLDKLNFDFLWHASRPRYLSDVELPEVKEKAGGIFTISGSLQGDQLSKKKAKHQKKAKGTKESGDSKDPKDSTEPSVEPKPETIAAELVSLNLRTERGVILLNVDPAMVPSDLHDRPLTEAAKGIVRSGDLALIEAIRKVSPKLFGDYARTLPPVEREPTLVRSSAPGQFVTAVAPQMMRIHASVTDKNGRSIGDLTTRDFTILENGTERKVMSVAPANEPFNLVLLLDVSGSVEERLDFIRKAARDFLRTASPQDRIAIISFRDDIQIISDFTTDRRLLSRKLDEIDAGGATALYDSLAYVLSTTLKPLRGERTAVVILSDGDDNKSFIPLPALLEATDESGALIYPLYVPSGLIPENSVSRPESTADPLRSRYLTLTTRAEEDGRKIANASGGVFYPIHRLEDLQRAYDDVVKELRSAYTITYASNSEPTHRRVKVRTNRDGSSVRLSPVVGVANP
ncbi:MAG TPA: VWA domain-containing protein [Pyrinomonadaceae bacterium]|nr:VWA domain-containing protein [Pyrinomonadaceae bacterium]